MCGSSNGSQAIRDSGKALGLNRAICRTSGVDVELSIKYGLLMRNVTFGKKMAILYSVEGEFVYIHRIIPQSMIIL